MSMCREMRFFGRAFLVIAFLLLILVIAEGTKDERKLQLYLRPSNAFAITAEDYNVTLLREDNGTRSVMDCSRACAQEQGGMAPCVAVSFDAATSSCKLWTQPAECAPYEHDGTDDLTLSLTVDNEYDVYADGAFVGTDRAWNANKQYTLPKYTHVVAVFGKNWAGGSPYGLIASMSSGVMTDASWRCVESAAPDTDYPGWKQACYDDSDWETPRVLGPKGMGPWGHSGSTYINPSAQWIWTFGGANNILCRVSPHRCLLNNQPAPSTDPSVNCTAVTPGNPATVLGSRDGQFVRLGSVLWHICDDATRVGMMCDVHGWWEVVRMPHSDTTI